MTTPALPALFYNRPPDVVARELLGALLVHERRGVLCGGRIVETEAYFAHNDPACHTARGKTRRNATMFGPPGHAYVYFCYGNHWLLNAVTEARGTGSAVLIRAIEPLYGLAHMQRRRGTVCGYGLTNGPGKLCAALGITGRHDGAPLWSGALRIHAPESAPLPCTAGPRIGISAGKELPARFFVPGNPWVSRHV